MRASRASIGGAANPLDAVAASLEFTASQLQPGMGELAAALGIEIDGPSFALGMIASVFAMQGMDIVKALPALPVQAAEFLERCRAMEGRTVCGHRSASFPNVSCGLDPDHKGKHGAGRLRW